MTTQAPLAASAVVLASGQGILTIGSSSQQITEADENAARGVVMRAVLAHARATRVPVRLEAKDSGGATAFVLIHPDGRAEPVLETLRFVPTRPVNPVGPIAITRPPGAQAGTPIPPVPPVPPAQIVARPVSTLDYGVGETRMVEREQTSHVLRFSTGEAVEVYGTGLIGRNPDHDLGQLRDHLVKVSNRTRTVSRTHVEFGHAVGQMWITDRNSGNGTAIRRGSSRIECTPGQRYVLAPGDTVEIGPDVSFTITSEG